MATTPAPGRYTVKQFLYWMFLLSGLLCLFIDSTEGLKKPDGLDIAVHYKNIYNLKPDGNETICVEWKEPQKKEDLDEVYMTIDDVVEDKIDEKTHPESVRVDDKGACFYMTADLFNEFGIHDLNITITNSKGNATKDVYIYYEEEPIGLEVDNKTVYVNINEMVNLTASLQNGTNIKAEWMVSVYDSNLLDFDDVVRQIYHVRNFSEVALHNVSLIVANELTSKVQFFNVCVQFPINNITFQPVDGLEVETQKKVTLHLDIDKDALVPMGNVDAYIEFGDGIKSETKNILTGIRVEDNIRNQTELLKLDADKLGKSVEFEHTYDKQGSYKAIAKLSSRTDYTEFEVVVEVWDKLDKLKLQPVLTMGAVNQDLEFRFKPTPTNTLSFKIDYGDGKEEKHVAESYNETFEDPHLKHPFAKAGTYTIFLHAFNQKNSKNDSVTIDIFDPIPKANLTPDFVTTTTADGRVNFSLVFEEGIIPDDAQCTIDFNDMGEENHTLTQKLFMAHRYKDAGIYNVSLTCRNSISRIDAEARVKVLAFTVDDFMLLTEDLWPMNVSSPTTVIFNIKLNMYKEKTPPPGVTLLWDFGDNSTIDQTSLDTWETEHEYAERGVYSGSVVVTHNGINVTRNFTIELGLLAMTVNTYAGLVNEGKFTFTIAYPLTLNFQYEVYFGDGASQTMGTKTTVDHVYNATGIYEAYVIGWNDTVSEEFHIKKSLTVDNRITNGLFIQNLKKIYFPPGKIQIQLKVPVGKADLDNITCHVSYGDDIDKEIYNFSSDISQEAPKILNYTYKTLGKHTIQSNCSNMLDKINLKSEVNVINFCFSTEGIFDRQYSRPATPMMAFTHLPVQIRGRLAIPCYDKGPEFYWEIYKVEGKNKTEIPMTQSYADYVRLSEGTLDAGLYEVSLNISFTLLAGNWFVEKTYIRYRDPKLISGINGGALRAITKKDVLIDATGLSYDPITGMGDLTDLRFEWTCFTIETTSVQELSTRHNDSTPIDCKEITMPVRQGVITFLGSRQQTKGFVFQVVVKKEKRSSYPARQLVQVLKDAPIINMKCLINCEMKKALSSELSVQTSCETCSETEKTTAVYKWTLKQLDNDSGKYNPVPGQDSWFKNTGKNPASVVMKANKMSAGVSYRLEVEVTVPGKKHPGFSSLDVLANIPPLGGTCSITPQIGYALETQFVASCTGWKDEGYRMTSGDNDLEEPKEYSFAIRKDDFFYSLFDHTGAASPKMKMPVAPNAKDENYNIEVKILDVMKDFTMVKLPITLHAPRIKDLIDIKDLNKEESLGNGLDSLASLDFGGGGGMDFGDAFSGLGDALDGISDVMETEESSEGDKTGSPVGGLGGGLGDALGGLAAVLGGDLSGESSAVSGGSTGGLGAGSAGGASGAMTGGNTGLGSMGLGDLAETLTSGLGGGGALGGGGMGGGGGILGGGASGNLGANMGGGNMASGNMAGGNMGGGNMAGGMMGGGNMAGSNMGGDNMAGGIMGGGNMAGGNMGGGNMAGGIMGGGNMAGGNMGGGNMAGGMMGGGNMAGGNMAGGNMAGGNMAGGNMVGRNMAGGNIAGGNMAGGNIAGGNIAGGNIAGGNMAGGNMVGGNMAGGNIAGGNMAGGNMVGGNIAGGNMAGGNMAGGNMAGRNMAGGNMAGGNMAGGNMAGGNRAGGNMGGGNMAGGNMAGGNMAGGNMAGGNMAGGSIAGGNNAGGNMRGGNIGRGNMAGGSMAGGNMAGGSMAGGNMAGGNIGGGNNGRGNMGGGNMGGGNMAGGKMGGGNMGGGNMAGGNMGGGNMGGGNLEGGNMGGGNMGGGNIAGGNMGGGNMGGGNMAGGNMGGGNVAGGNMGGGNVAGGNMAGGRGTLEGGNFASGNRAGAAGGNMAGGNMAGGNRGGNTAGGSAGGNMAGSSFSGSHGNENTVGGNMAGGIRDGNIVGGTSGRNMPGGNARGSGISGGNLAGGSAGGNVGGGALGGNMAGGSPGGNFGGNNEGRNNQNGYSGGLGGNNEAGKGGNGNWNNGAGGNTGTGAGGRTGQTGGHFGVIGSAGSHGTSGNFAGQKYQSGGSGSGGVNGGGGSGMSGNQMGGSGGGSYGSRGGSGGSGSRQQGYSGAGIGPGYGGGNRGQYANSGGVSTGQSGAGRGGISGSGSVGMTAGGGGMQGGRGSMRGYQGPGVQSGGRGSVSYGSGGGIGGPAGNFRGQGQGRYPGRRGQGQYPSGTGAGRPYQTNQMYARQQAIRRAQEQRKALVRRKLSKLKKEDRKTLVTAIMYQKGKKALQQCKSTNSLLKSVNVVTTLSSVFNQIPVADDETLVSKTMKDGQSDNKWGELWTDYKKPKTSIAKKLMVKSSEDMVQTLNGSAAQVNVMNGEQLASLSGSLAMVLQAPEKTSLKAAIESTELGYMAAVQLHNLTKQRPYPAKDEIHHGTSGVVNYLGNVLKTTTPDSSLRMPSEITEDTMSTPQDSSDTHYEENLFLLRKNAQSNLLKKLKKIEATKKVLPKVEKAIDHVLKTMETMVVKNEKKLTYKSDTLSLSVQKRTPETIKDSVRAEEFEATFVAPKLGQNFLEALQDPVVDTVVFKENPYVNSVDDSSDDITSSVLQLTLKDNETVINVPIKLKIRTPKPPREGVYRMKDTMSGPSQMMYHRFLLRRSDDSTFIYVRVPFGVTNVTAYLRQGRAPTMMKYDVRVTGLKEEWKGKEAYKIIIPAHSVENGTVYLALKMTFLPGTVLERVKRDAIISDVSNEDFQAGEYYEDFIQFNTSEAVYGELEDGEYGLVIVTDGCRVWDPIKEIWDAKACVISKFSTPEETFCSCTHSPGKSFATTFYVPPNTIDFSLVFTKFDPSNAAVYGLIIGIVAMYFLSLVWARRQDKRDIERWRVGYLMDNLNTDKCFYLLQVHTGLRKNSGTESRISFVLAGENGDTGVRILGDGKRSIATGTVMNYILAVPRQLGDLSYMRIWHDNSGVGSKASWFLNKIVVEDLQSQQRYIFVCDHWLAVDKEEGIIDRVLPVSVKDDFMTFDKLFSEHARLNITDTHLWLSIFMRPERCTFSRVQRVSCCLALMFLMMISSAMFFRSAAEKEEEQTIRHEVKIGALRFSMTSFYVSLVGLMVTMPPTILLVMIFKSSKPKNRKGEVNVSRMKSVQQQDAENDVLANRYRNKPLPHFCVYVGWVLLFLIVTTCGFFLILYSMQWGREVSEEWLTSFFMCFAQSVVVMDPLKVVILAILLAFCLRDPFDSKGEIDIARVETEARLLGKDELDLLLPPEPLPPDVLARARRRRRKEVRAQSVFLELIQYIIFLFAIYSLSFGNRDDRSFMIHEHIENNLFAGSVNTEYPFEGIQSFDNFFTWAQSTLIPRLFPETDLTGSRLPWRKRLFFSDLTNFRVGPARIRQLRMPRHQSPFYGSQYSSLVSNQNYYGAYSLFSEDVTNYCLQWKKMPCPKNEEVLSLTTPAWKYTSSSDVWGLPVAGQYKIYSGGGYMLELNVNLDVSKDMLQELYDNSWLDRRTRAVFVEFTLYNAFVNIMAYVRLAAEFPETGSTIIWHDIMTFRLDQHHGSLGAYVLLCEIVIAVILIMFTITLMKKLWEQKLGFFLHVWQTLDLLTVIWCMVAVVFYIIREVNASETLTRFRDNPKKFVNFQHIAVWDNLFVYSLGALVFSTTIRILRILGYNKRVTIIAAVLSNSAKDLTGFGIVFGIVFFAYVLSGYILFSAHYYGYHTIYDSMFTIFTYMLGKNIMARLMLIAPIWAQIYFSTLVFFIIFVLLTMFQAIMNNSMTVVRDNLKKVPPPYGLVNVVLNIYRAIIRDWLPDSFFKNSQNAAVMEELRRRPTYQVMSTLRDQLNLAVSVKGAFKKPLEGGLVRESLEAKILKGHESKEYGVSDKLQQLGSHDEDQATHSNEFASLADSKRQVKNQIKIWSVEKAMEEHRPEFEDAPTKPRDLGREKARERAGQRSGDAGKQGPERPQRRRQRIEQ